jgi:TRAP-type C4-dicarboxylate transport system permease small subunit
MVVLLQILARNYIKVPMVWTSEVALFCFLWSVYLGTAVAVRSRQHYIVELLPNDFIRTKAIMTTFSDIVIFSLIFVLVWGGVKFTQMGLHRFLVSIPLSMAWLFVAMPISGAVMFLFGIENIVDDVINLKKLFKGRA